MSHAGAEPLGAAPSVWHRTGVLIAVGAVVTVGVLPVFLVGGVAVQIRAELGMSVSALGLAGSAFFATSAVVARPLAALTERIGPSAALRLASAGSGLCLGALAAAPSTGWLLVALCLAGLPAALSQPAANELLMARVAAHRRGFAFAVKQSAIPASTLLAGLAVPSLALTVGWRWAFALAGLLALLTVFAVPALAWQRPDRSDRDNAAAGRGQGARAPGSRAPGAEPAVLVLLALAVGTGLGAAAANAMGTFVTVSAVTVGYTPAAAGLVLVLGSAVGVVMRLVAGIVADRARPDLLWMVTTMLTLGAVGYLLLALGSPVSFIVGLVLGFGAGWAWPGVFNFAVATRFPDRVTTATSVTQTGVYVGAALGPLLFGLLAQYFGVSAAWLACAGFAALAAATLMVVQCGMRR